MEVLDLEGLCGHAAADTKATVQRQGETVPAVSRSTMNHTESFHPPFVSFLLANEGADGPACLE